MLQIYLPVLQALYLPQVLPLPMSGRAPTDNLFTTFIGGLANTEQYQPLELLLQHSSEG